MAVYENGIDVSRYQGDINWPSVAASGKQFAIVRVGSSNSNGTYVDPYFLKNINGAKAAGLKVGAYYYTYAKTRAAVATELETYLAALEGLQLEYPVFVDVEASSLQSVGATTLTGLVIYAMDILDQRGWYPGWYSYTNFVANYLDASRLRAYPFWIADYRGYVGYNGAYDIWQYSSQGTVNGISGAVDLNYSYRNFLPSIREAGKNGYSSAGPDMQAVSGVTLEVFNSNCEYFYGPNFNDIVGYLPLGVYTVITRSSVAYNGYIWVTFEYGGGIYWTAILSDRNRLVINAGTDCEMQLAEARRKIEAARAALA